MADEIATVAGGCFWCVEAVFQDIAGVKSVESGYIGGEVVNPTYKQVCGGDTGHAEALRITYDPSVLSYGDLLDIFFHTHDPTQLNRQGNDIGTQYRSAIFPNSPEQEAEAREAKARNQADWDKPIVTTIEPDDTWYPAEDYHQGYWPGQSLLPGGDPAQAGQAAQELSGAAEGCGGELIAGVAGRASGTTSIIGAGIADEGNPANVRMTDHRGAAARPRRSLMAMPSPQSGMGATAMAARPDASASCRASNRFAAASTRSPWDDSERSPPMGPKPISHSSARACSASSRIG